MEAVTENTIVDGHACTTGLLGMARSWHADVSLIGQECEKDHLRLIHWLAHLLTQWDDRQAEDTINLLDAAGFTVAYERDTHRITLACDGHVFTRTITGKEGMAYLLEHPVPEIH